MAALAGNEQPSVIIEGEADLPTGAGSDLISPATPGDELWDQSLERRGQWSREQQALLLHRHTPPSKAIKWLTLFAQFLFAPHLITAKQEVSYTKALSVRLGSAVTWGLIFGLALFLSYDVFYNFISQFIPLDAILGESFVNLFMGMTALAMVGQLIVHAVRNPRFTSALFFDPGKLSADSRNKNLATAFRILNPMIWATLTFLVSYFVLPSIFAINMSIASSLGFSIIAVVTSIIGQNIFQRSRLSGRGYGYENHTPAQNERITEMGEQLFVFRLLFAPSTLLPEKYRGLAYFLNIFVWGLIVSGFGFIPAISNFISTNIPLSLLGQPFGVPIVFGMVGMFCALVGQAIDATINEWEDKTYPQPASKTPLGRLGTFIFNLLLHPQNYIDARNDDANNNSSPALSGFWQGALRGANVTIWTALTALLAFSAGAQGDLLAGITAVGCAFSIIGQAVMLYRSDNRPPPAPVVQPQRSGEAVQAEADLYAKQLKHIKLPEAAIQGILARSTPGPTREFQLLHLRQQEAKRLDGAHNGGAGAPENKQDNANSASSADNRPVADFARLLPGGGAAGGSGHPRSVSNPGSVSDSFRLTAESGIEDGYTSS